MKNLVKACGNLKLSIILFLLFAFSCAMATFIESSYGTPTAWVMIYGTLWFGLIQLLLGINLIFAIFAYKMIELKKLPVLIFHLSFLFILAGSIFTRYFGLEGLMHIRESEKSSTFESSKSFIKFYTLENGQVKGLATPQDIAILPFANHFKLDLKLEDSTASLRYKNLLLDAKEKFIEDKEGKPLLSLVINLKDEGVKELILQENEVQNIAGINFAFLNDEVKAPFIKVDKNLELSSSQNLNFLSMSSGENAVLKASEKANSSEKRLYDLKDFNFVIKDVSLSAKQSIVGANRAQDESFWLWFKGIWAEFGRTLLISFFGEPQNWKASSLLAFKDFAMSKEYQPLELGANAVNALELELEYKGEKTSFFVFENDKPVRVDLGSKAFFVGFSPYTEDLGFSLLLKDFKLDRYAGSMSPKSYESLVEIDDEDNKFEFNIFMNNVLDYKGYRFYQSSYDQDEKGTILSINQDPGKLTTYVGYTLLFIGMFLNIFNPKSRFRTLARLINQDALKNSALILLLSLCFLSPNLKAEELGNLSKISPEHSQKFGALIVQKFSGRMVPLNTLSSEILEKVYKDTSYKGLSSDAVVLSMFLDKQEIWGKEKLIIMPKNKAIRDEIARILGVKSEPYLAFEDFFNQERQYILTKYVENANRKNPNARGVFDKEIIKLDERVNIVFLALTGELFRIIPKQNDENHTWLTIFELLNLQDEKERQEGIVPLYYYFASLGEAVKSGDYSEADKALEGIKNYQYKYASEVMPSEGKIKAELFMNKNQIFVKLTPVYLLAGIFLLVLILAKMIKPNLRISLIFKLVYTLNIIAFLIHTAGLCLRAYLADHAPWSNAYESMVYIAWALALSGIFFSRKSPIALALTSILAGLVLWVAHLSEMDPQITNLVPVLDSYWLTIHVSVITASYGFLGLCCLLGIFVLALMLFLKKDGKYNANIQRNITEATRINEMAMILGLCLLTAGNFLGAIWANESWGRYWSWDSKETWALISILVYASVLHIRLIPSLCNQFNFALSSMFAYWSIIMTYFGVNYFLVGLHSYAAGEAAKIPNYVYFSFLFMVILAIIAYPKRKMTKKL
ncbi:cytochrome C biogenesis protein [Campylobacter sp. MIT 12-5580]|uniref:cytochrome c biogenesis protein n=1 Tax=Campylobacter sp. MIT 12-5580 TaxID=2040651 RepID=UPI0010F90C77|nr:cytochrome c biogenesis protein CcsA [Campylobacter sp. MIT 12-5580]TKX28332.1 cytochrome C biogenesis protein [Campylobacter sp. MIT 12-5580]